MAENDNKKNKTPQDITKGNMDDIPRTGGQGNVGFSESQQRGMNNDKSVDLNRDTIGTDTTKQNERRNKRF